MNCHRCGIDLSVKLFMKFTPLIYTYRTKIECKLNGCILIHGFNYSSELSATALSHQYCIREQPSVFVLGCIVLIVRVCACMHVFQKKDPA